MKLILKASLLAVALVFCVNVSAQMEFGVKAGANMSNVTGNKSESDMKIGFQAGVTMDYGFSETMGIQTGLLFVTKGSQKKVGEVKTTSNPMYLQLPVHFAYKAAVGETSKVVLHAGPYAAYGIGGKTKTTGIPIVAGIDLNGESDIFVKDGPNKFDCGVGGGVGMEFGKMGVDLSVDYGLTELAKNSKTHNLTAYLSLGYKF